MSEKTAAIAALVASLEAQADKLRPTGLRIVSQIDYRAKILKGVLQRRLKAEKVVN